MNTIKRWTIVVGIFAVMFVGLALWLVPWEFGNIAARGGVDLTGAIFILTLSGAAILYGLSLTMLIKERYSLGGKLAIIGGVLTIPIGVVAIIAGVRIRSAATILDDEAFNRSLNLEGPGAKVA